MGSTDSASGASSTPHHHHHQHLLHPISSPSTRSRARSQDRPPLLGPITSHSSANGSFLDLNELGYSSPPPDTLREREINLNHLDETYHGIDNSRRVTDDDVVSKDHDHHHLPTRPSTSLTSTAQPPLTTTTTTPTSRRRPSPIQRPPSHHRLTDSFETARTPSTAREGVFNLARQLGEGGGDGKDVVVGSPSLAAEDYKFPASSFGQVPPPSRSKGNSAVPSTSTSSASLLNLPPPITYATTSRPQSLAIPPSSSTTHTSSSSSTSPSMIKLSSSSVEQQPQPRREVKNKGFIVTSRPSPSSSNSGSASSSAATSPAATTGLLPLITSLNQPIISVGGSTGSSQTASPYLSPILEPTSSRQTSVDTSTENDGEIKWLGRAGSISGVLAEARGGMTAVDKEFPTIRQVGGGGDGNDGRTFTDLPREESIYPFGGISTSVDALTMMNGGRNRGFIDAPMDNEDTTINPSHPSYLSVPRRPSSLLTQQILSSPAIHTDSHNTTSSAQGSLHARTSTSQPSSSHSTPKATPTRMIPPVGNAGLSTPNITQGNNRRGSIAGTLNKRSNLLGGWTHHFSGSSVSEHEESNLTRGSSKGKERAYDDDLSRQGGTAARSGRRNGSVSAQGKSQERQRNISNGSAESGLVGKDRLDVIETAELNFIRDPNSGRKMINQYLILHEIGRGQHGTVRLGKDLSVYTPEMSRGGTASSSASALVSRQSSSSHVSRQPSAGPSLTALDELAPSSIQEDRNREPESSESRNNSNTSQSLLAQAALHLDEAGSLTDVAGSTQGDGSFWAIKIVDRFARKRLPGVHAVREGYTTGGPARGAGSTGEKIKREIAILKKCRHPNVVRLREVIDAPASKKIYLILEYCKGGELKWKSQDGQPDLTLDETRRIFRDVVCGLQYLHHQGIIHRDIKPANLLFGEGDVVKISDFGVSHYSHVLRGASDLEEGESPEDDDPAFMDDHELAKTAGSPAFFAPELCYNGDTTPLSSITPGREKGEFNYPSFNAAVARARPESSAVGGTAARSDTPTGHSRRLRPPITEAIDVWALGVTLYCLLFGKVPFEAPSEYALFSIIPIDDYEIPPYLGADKLPTGGRHSYKAGKASGIAEEVREVLDILEKLLEKDPTKRIKLPEVKKHPFTLRGLSDQSAWLARTDPAMETYVTVSTDEVAAAVTAGGSFRDKFRKGFKQITQKLQVFAGGGSRSGGRSRSGSFVNTPIDEHPPGDYRSQVPSVAGSGSPGQKNAQKGSSRGSPRIASGGSETSVVRSPSPKPPSLSRRFSLLGGSHQVRRAESPAAPGHMQFHSPSTLTLHLPDRGDRLGRSISDRSTTSSGFAPFRIGERRGSNLAPPMSIFGSSVGSSQERLPRGLASSTSAEELNKIIARHIMQPQGSETGRSASGLSLRRRQSSDIDGAGRQRTLSNASSKGGNLHKIARYLSRGLSQKSSSASSHVSSPYSGPRDQLSPPSDEMEESSQSGQGSPAPVNAALRSVYGDDPSRKSIDTMSSTSDVALHSLDGQPSTTFPPLALPDWDPHEATGTSLARVSDDPQMHTQESYDLESGVDLSDDDEEDYGEVRQYNRTLNSPRDLLEGSWRLNSSGWRGEELPPSQGLGLVTDNARFRDADEGAEDNGSPTTIMQSANAHSEDPQTPHAATSAISNQRVAPPSPNSSSQGAVTSFAEHRRRSMSRGSLRGSPLRSSLPDRSRSPFGISDKLLSPMRFPDSFHEDDDEEDEDEEGDEGLAIEVGFKRGRRPSKPMTPMASGHAPVQ